MKKLIALVLSSMLVLSAFAGLMTVSAEGECTITAKSVETAVEPGDTVTVEFEISNNPGWYSFTFTPVYDTTRLALEINNDNVWVNLDEMDGDLTLGTRMVWLGGDEDSNFNGVFMKLTFTVLDNAPAGEAEVSLSWNLGDLCNYDEEDVTPVMVAGTVTVDSEFVETEAEDTTVADAEDTTAAEVEDTTAAEVEDTTAADAEDTTAAEAEDTTAAATEAATTTAAATTKGGCKSVVATAGALMLVSVLAAGAVICKKKD